MIICREGNDFDNAGMISSAVFYKIGRPAAERLT